MPIVSYKIEPGAIQKDGTLSIVERFFREDGSEVMLCSFVDPKIDLDALAVERIAEIEAADSAPEPIQDPIDTKFDEIKAAYRLGDFSATKALLAEATAAVDAKETEEIKV